MFNSTEDGREYIQGYFSDGDSFGEPPLFYDGLYPAHGIAESDATLIRLKKEALMLLLRENIDELFKITTTFAIRLKDKSIRSGELALHEPKHRITTLLTEFKKKDSGTSSNEQWLVPFTRQQIADMTGLRVETVIRIVREMEKRGLLEIRDRKIYF
jgi:CRP-like cAMP-binding protein